jgi:hypothetical protein
MAAIRRLQKLENELNTLEARFTELLLESLRRCERGRWGLFGQSGAATSTDGKELLQLVEAIDRLRTRLGHTERNSLCVTFLDYRKKRGSNDLGEPKLASKFLARSRSKKR